MEWKEIEDKQGVFCLSSKDLKEDISLIQRIMSNIIVTRCEYYFSGEIFVYEAVSPMFDDVEPGMKPQAYRFGFDEFNDLFCRKIDANYQFFK